jgi:hypothetical protein
MTSGLFDFYLGNLAAAFSSAPRRLRQIEVSMLDALGHLEGLDGDRVEALGLGQEAAPSLSDAADSESAKLRTISFAEMEMVSASAARFQNRRSESALATVVGAGSLPSSATPSSSRPSSQNSPFRDR